MTNDLVSIAHLPGTYRVVAVRGTLYSLLPADKEARQYLRETLDPVLQARRGLQVDTLAPNIRPAEEQEDAA